MRKNIKLICILLCLIFIIPFTACNDSKDAYLYFELPEIPQTLDPQLASSNSELLVVRNIFEGLLRKDETGKIVNGITESYTKDGLTYTFKLKKNAKWSDGSTITAKDFEFGFKRALNPVTKAPFASRLFCIKNARQINSGSVGANNLGVNAINKHTLKITLEYEDNLFLETLTTSVAMPCNEKFFYETDGKYGIFAESLLSCGSYRLSRWKKENFGIRLYRNENYNGTFIAKNAAAFLTCNKDKDTLEQLKKNNIDIAFIDSTLETEAKSSELKTVAFENICWVLTIGDSFTDNMRKSLSMLIGSKVYSDSLAEGYSFANSVFPSSINSNTLIQNANNYDLESAKKLYFSELKRLPNKKFPTNALLYYYDNGSVKPVVTDIVGHWQANLAAFINIETASNPELLLPQLSEQSYSFAFFPIRADSNRADEYLKKFGITENLSFQDAQNIISSDNSIIPIMFQNTVIAYHSTLKNLNSEFGNGYIDFSFIIKED